MQSELDIIQTVRATTSQQITIEPTYLFGILLTDDAVGACSVALYDGANSSGDLLLDVQNLSTETKVVSFEKPMVFRKGLYLSCGSNVKSCTLLFASVEN